MAYSRGQPNFGSGSIDSRDGYRMQNEINVAVSRQPVNIPVIAASDPWYSAATYPGFRGSSVPAERDGPGRQQANNAALQQSVSYAAEPASTKSYRSFVSTQLGGTGQGSGSKNAYSDVTVTQNSASSYIGATSSLPNRRRSDGSAVSTQSYPIPVSSQIVYSSRAAPGGQSGLAGKVAVASSRRAEYSSGLASDATPINQPRFRQIPVVVVPSQATRQGGERPDERSFHQTALHRDRLPQSPSVTNKNAVGSVSHSVSAAPTFSKEAEFDALTDLLVQNMNVAGNPDFCGMCVKCGRSVMGEKSRCVALDQLFHVDCFRCQACNNCLSGQPFYAMEGQPHCELCYMQTLEKCSVCSKPIVDRMLRATGKPYHPRCFTCVVCGRNLDGLTFTVDATNQIHCIDDFHRKFAPRCSVCSLPITPGDSSDNEAMRIVVLDRNFHVECFRCEDCGLMLLSDVDGRGCFPLDDHVLCKACNARRIQILTGKVTTDL